MSIMIPTVPKQYTPESDEDKIFYALKNLTGDPIDKKNDYYVFHSFKINQINDENNALERHETDFVIFHPSKGVLCIECKSGPSGKLMVQNGAWHRAKIIKGRERIPPKGIISPLEGSLERPYYFDVRSLNLASVRLF